MPDDETTVPVENEENTNTEEPETGETTEPTEPTTGDETGEETEPEHGGEEEHGETIETVFDLFTAVSAVISQGLDADYWMEQEAKQKAAFNTACGDIFARLPGVKPEDVSYDQTNIIYAIAEQAVYLLRHYGEQTTGQQKASESVDGLSISYSSLVSSTDGILSPRALAYLEQAKAELKRAKILGIRFNRG